MSNTSVEVKLRPPTTAFEVPEPEVINELSVRVVGTPPLPNATLPEFAPEPKTTGIPEPITPEAAATTLPSSTFNAPLNGV
jgi:hypothetical protein